MPKTTQDNFFDASLIDDDELDNSPSKKPGYLFLLWIFAPLILWAIGLCEIQSGSGLSPLSFWVRYFFFLAGLHVVLLGPVIFFAYPELKKIHTPVLRKLALFAFLAPPLLSLGYFLGQIQHSGSVFEWLMLTSSLIVMGIHIFERTQSLTLFSFGLSSALYLQWFGLSDILGPYKTWYTLVPKSDLFYWGRTLLSVLCLSLSSLTLKRNMRTNESGSIKNRNFVFIFMMFLGGALYFGLPWVLAHFEPTTPLHISWLDFGFVGMAPLVLAELKPAFARSKLGIGFKIALLVLMVFRAFELMTTQSATLSSMSWVSYDLIVASMIGLSFL